MNSEKLTQVRSQGLDKFYTNPPIVDKCIEDILKYYKWDDFDYVIEPSAGSGNFYKKIEHTNKIGLDIRPEDEDVIKKDYFKFIPDKKYKKILILGNPPFGKNSSLALQFFNYSAKFADVLAFIIPKTFRKISIQNKLNREFHLINDEDIPNKPCSFTPKMNVKCCFQIWQKKKELRELIKLPTVHKDWEFIRFGPNDKDGQPTPPTDVDFALRAYGGKCGVIEKNIKKLRPKSWHWIKSNIDIDDLITNFKKLDYSNSENSARQNSIGKGELVQLYTNIHKN